MDQKNYLEGFIPYKREVIESYVENGAWLNLSYGELLDRTSSRYPDHIAVIDNRNRLTYKMLKEKVDRLAIALIQLGIKPHDRMIIQLPNRHEFVVAFYALQKIGAIPVLAIPRHDYQEIAAFSKLADPVGWILPLKEEKLEFAALIENIRSEFEHLKHIIMPDDGRILPPYAYSLEKLIEEVHLEDYDPNYLNQFRPDPNDVAVLIPTGGTTGLPKIVPRTHNSLIVTNKYISKDMTDADCLIQITPVGHAMAIQGSVNCAMYRGARLVLQRIPRPKEILETIQKEKVTRSAMVPPQLEGIINYPELDQYDLSSLRTVGTAGAGLPGKIAEKAADYFSQLNCKFLGNSLGASEGLLAQGDFTDPLSVKLGTVGRNVIHGSHYKVINEKEEELPRNTEGELVAKGPEVFTGYYKTTKEENKEVFTNDDYYRTGDLAKIDEQGYITITGRKKDVIIRGGETLVPSTMENLLRKHPDVKDTAVVGMPDPVMGERICAYIVSKSGKSLKFEVIINFLKSQGAGVLLLPERLVFIDSLPLTRVGKVDKEALRADVREKLKQEAIT